MGAVVNGLALSKLRAFGATFFVFSDYARPAIRLSALMELPTLFVFTHDAMGDGEDGPTHQPVEHLASMRAIPGLVLLRPGDANEVVESFRVAMQLRHQPAVFALSRQALPTLDRKRYASAAGVARGRRRPARRAPRARSRAPCPLLRSAWWLASVRSGFIAAGGRTRSGGPAPPFPGTCSKLTTRNVSLTDAGRLLIESSGPALVEQALAALREVGRGFGLRGSTRQGSGLAASVPATAGAAGAAAR
jgi:hypothetical protein